MVWFGFSIFILLFITSSVGLSYAANSWIRRQKRSNRAGCLMSLAIALLWPAIVVGYIFYDASRYQAQNPYDDAPAMVVISFINIGAPLLFCISLALAFLGMALAHSRNPVEGRPDDKPAIE
jgi:hypothetical protein